MLKKGVAVLGLGIENLALAEYLIGQGEKVTVCDNRSAEELGERYQRLAARGVDFRLGDHSLEQLDVFGTLYRSPGFPLFHPALIQARANGVRVSSAMRLFLQRCPCPVIGATGTKGKGLLRLIQHVGAEPARKRGPGLLAGIGVAPFSFFARLQPDDLVVLELSVFAGGSGGKGRYCGAPILPRSPCPAVRLIKLSTIRTAYVCRKPILRYQSPSGVQF